LDKEGAVINFIGFQQGAEDSIRLRCPNDPRPRVRASPKEIRGGGRCHKYFDDYYSYHGIRREKRVRGTPQENGVL
jgi:hypothetical protein